MSNLFLLFFIVCFLCVPIYLLWAFINIVRKQPAKKYFKLSGIFILLSVVSLIMFGLALDDETDTTAANMAELSSQNGSAINDDQEIPMAYPDLESNTIQENSDPGVQEKEIEKLATDKSTLVNSGSYVIAGETFEFSDSVMNDVTGNWRLSLTASSKDTVEYAIDYYNTLFTSNDEIHAIVNFTKNTTSKISVIYDGMLDITIYEYVNKEEHDAQLLFSGMLLNEYWLNTKTGEIEEIQ